MLIEFMKSIGVFYYWTWFVWPFVLVFSLVHGIVTLIKDEKASLRSLFVAGAALLIILAGMVSPIL